MLKQAAQCRRVLVVNFFRLFMVIYFYFVVAIFDLVHDMGVNLHLISYLQFHGHNS